jgi:hypothetical protein
VFSFGVIDGVVDHFGQTVVADVDDVRRQPFQHRRNITCPYAIFGETMQQIAKSGATGGAGTVGWSRCSNLGQIAFTDQRARARGYGGAAEPQCVGDDAHQIVGVALDLGQQRGINFRGTAGSGHGGTIKYAVPIG